MDSTAFQRFTDQLRDNITHDPHVLGLIALGSMATLARRDDWSDHDFFLIVASGHQESYRQAFDWLPDAHQIVMTLRETAHGLKVMYASTHLIEFAVFDLEELNLARVNDYAVLLDKTGGAITARLADLARISEPAPTDAMYALLSVIGILQAGSGRCARGETLSGHAFIKFYAFSHLMKLLTAVLESPDKPRLDNLDVFRRFEQVYPQIGAELNAALLLPPVDCASAMLDIIEREVKPRLADFPQPAVDTLRRHLAHVSKSLGL